MTPTSSPQVSVIVPVRNGASALPALLRSLSAQTLHSDLYEIIVVDNGSTDNTAEIARGLGAKVVYEAIANRSRARNRGAAESQAPLYAFTDADCVSEASWLEQLLKNADKAPLLAGRVRTRISQDPNAIERFESLWRFNQKAWVEHLGWAATANLLVHRTAFEKLGGFDPAWRHIGEDADFCVRARRVGLELAYCETAVVEHGAERELGALVRRCFRHGYSANQAVYRIGLGERAWRHPLVAVAGDEALRKLGYAPAGFERGEWRRMARLARLAYAARIVGSVWAELVRAR